VTSRQKFGFPSFEKSQRVKPYTMDIRQQVKHYTMDIRDPKYAYSLWIEEKQKSLK
jgi:hypothetical protein